MDGPEEEGKMLNEGRKDWVLKVKETSMDCDRNLPVGSCNKEEGDVMGSHGGVTAKVGVAYPCPLYF
jgi:hypothetical protein